MQTHPFLAAIEASHIIIGLGIAAIIIVVVLVIGAWRGHAIFTPVLPPPPRVAGMTFRTFVALLLIALVGLAIVTFGLFKNTADGDARVEESLKNGHRDEFKKLDAKIDSVDTEVKKLGAAIDDVKTGAAGEIAKLGQRIDGIDTNLFEAHNRLDRAASYAEQNTRRVNRLTGRVGRIENGNAATAAATKDGAVVEALNKGFAETLAAIQANSKALSDQQQEFAKTVVDQSAKSQQALAEAITGESAKTRESFNETLNAIRQNTEAFKEFARVATNRPSAMAAPAPEPTKPATAKPAPTSTKVRTGGEATSGTYLEPAKGVTIKSPGGLFKPGKGEYSLDVTYEVEWKAPQPVPTARANEIIGKAVAQFQQFELAKFAFDDYERDERDKATAKMEKLVSAFVRSCDDREALEGLTVSDVTLRMTRPVKVR